MPLLDILTDIEKDSGQTLSDPERSIRLADINNAAREIHVSTDLPEAVKEEAFIMTLPSQQIALPHYIDKVLGMRYVDNRIPIDRDDMHNRYNYQNIGEHEVWYLQWRDRGLSPLSREINNQSTLTFAFPTGLTSDVDFTITITGTTDRARRFQEVLTWHANSDTSVQTSEQWKAVESIVKSVLTKYDITVTDADSNVMAVLPNSEYQSQFRQFQIIDTESYTQPTSPSGIEVLFKHKFYPFSKDQDTYFGTDRYDKAFYWKYMELRSKSADDAAAYFTKCQQVLVDAMSDHIKTLKRKINFSPVAFFHLPYYRYADRGW